MLGRMPTTPVYLEVGSRRVFACAVEWPGWCRSARTEEQALAALGYYAPRYAAVAATAGVEFPIGAGADFDVRDRVGGNATTDFGAPAVVPELDRRPVDDASAARRLRLVVASWQVLDRVVATAPASLRKGPRGGGRDRDKVVAHVLAAEAAYLRKIGAAVRQPALDDAPGVAALRAAAETALSPPWDGTASRENGWPRAYAARRIAWHVLDHAWEIEDRSES
jgi:hypothetical protein